MAIMKNVKVEVKPFKFGELVPEDIHMRQESAEKFEFKSLKDAANFKNFLSDTVIRQEREYEAATRFKIDPRIREHRGIVEQEQNDYEQRVAQEVERRLQILAEEAYQDGLNQGKQLGEQKAYDEAMQHFAQLVDECKQSLQELVDQRQNILAQSQDEAYKLIRNLTKWVVLKEVKDDKYIQRLLEKLILEMNTKSNLLIRVNEDSFSNMPTIIKLIEERLGQLTNVRVEIEHDLNGKGIILESENGIIDGSLEAQFRSIDKLFEAVGIQDET
jgi:flagellar assembly protein FliH